MSTYQEVYDLINNLLPDNTTQLISEQDLRTVTHAINDRTQQAGFDTLDIEWAADTTYSADDLVTYLDRIWKSKQDNNTGNQPPEDPLVTSDSWWEEQSRADSSTIREWAAGVYGSGLIIVFYSDKLYKLNVGDRPYLSTDIVAEIAAGDWVSLSEGGSGLSIANLKITKATLDTMVDDSVLVDVLGAPGANKINRPILVLAKGASSGGYDNDIFLRWETEAVPLCKLPTTNNTNNWVPITPGNVAFEENIKLQLQAPAAGISGGTIDLYLVILYQQIDVSGFTDI